MRNIVLILFISLLVACGQQNTQKTGTVQVISEPENLLEYFYQLLADSANYYIPGDSLERGQIIRSFRLLQDYVVVP